MPEGPEVQQVVNSLSPNICSKTIKTVEVLHDKITMPIKSIGRQNIELFSNRLIDTKILELERKGKYLIFKGKNKSSDDLFIVAHLGMTGAFFVVKDFNEITPKYRKHIHIIFRLDDNSSMVYSDQRRFGWVGALEEKEFLNYNPIQKIGPDPFDENAPERFIANMRRKTSENKPIKKLLLQPEIIAGIGNIYASECLFKANIHPMTPSKDITDKKLMELLSHVRETFALAIRLGGSSIRDYVNSEGQKGTFQEHFKVYGKKDCPECGHPLENVRIDNRSSFYCPSCQKK
ncbi:bifunctional DNA-formamidopyrimidine glycosylase/DNA-(apurinic or apyrimidinic site) lyase [Neobacillus sp. NPDC093127]|uniref:bifunctional DNA-formamidopyrimidine glycosylase/DNA-(apurinic or apyrimidinic site) lyase n=1 Tax=Neobacillus sp. NPDC093127 TaxID=3364296 RepID=UPI0038285909